MEKVNKKKKHQPPSPIKSMSYQTKMYEQKNQFRKKKKEIKEENKPPCLT